jgi:FKBP-type peptidyl-prolyl cis-trans isomerase FklB
MAFFLALLAVASNEFGVTFLAENSKKEGVITLPSGLQYKILRPGQGADHPTAESPCECHYEGRTAQKFAENPTSPSNTFDGSYARGSPTTFAPNQVIKGWTEGACSPRLASWAQYQLVRPAWSS